MGRYIIAGAKQVAVPFEVLPLAEHKLTFPGLKPRPRTAKVVLHWTGGERGYEGVHDTLRKGGLSVHFLIETSGRIVQYVDADRLCAGATGMNVDGVHIEIVNRANTLPNAEPRRVLLRETIRGRDTRYTAFLPVQVRAAIDLTVALCEHYGLPKLPPLDAKRRLVTRELTPAELAKHRGPCGHYHWSPRGKVDPGLALLRALAVEVSPCAGRGVDGPLRDPGPAQ
jgi:N-acetyl-anhydromuramyl-L-alanine amidase AmpD